MPLRTPLDVHGVTTPEDYKAAQRKYLGGRHVPRFAEISPPVAVEGDTLKLRCVCNNYPVVHAKWRLACCFECGRIYENLRIPAEYA